eukprot:1360205-Rhodomonas_salina.3
MGGERAAQRVSKTERRGDRSGHLRSFPYLVVERDVLALGLPTLAGAQRTDVLSSLRHILLTTAASASRREPAASAEFLAANLRKQLEDDSTLVHPVD